VEDAIIAVVNEEAITFKDLKDYLNSIYLQLKLSGITDEEIDAIMKEMQVTGIDKLIEDKLIINKANKRGLEVREELVDKRIDEIRSQYPSEQDFLDSILTEGITITDLQNEIRDQLKIKYIIDFEVRSKIIINPQEVTDYYNKNLGKFKKPERMDLASIFFAIDEKNEASVKEKAYNVLRMLKERNRDFDEVAAQFSDGPSIGIIEKGQLLLHIEEAVFKSLEEVKENISNMLFHLKFRHNFQGWVDDLKKDAFIDIKG
jgi:parvulin-like peptidyl-prolyl isomerase